MIQNSTLAALPPSNIDVEIALLGSILLDSNAIYQVAETLPPEAFYVESHREIYKAALALYKKQQPVVLATVTNYLADNDLLQKVGGRNKLAILFDSCVSSANVEAYADLLIEKHIRRQLVSLSTEVEVKAFETEKPLSWILENLEQRLLKITQLRNAKGKGYWQKVDDVAFERLCKELDEVEAIENTAQRDWLMKKLAKKWKFSNKKELLDFHAKWLDSKSKTKTYTSKEYFEKYGLSEQDWLIPGFVPAESVIVLYADGGVGKTRLAFSLAKSAVTGGVFAYEGTEFTAMNTLLIETDQGPRITSKLLEMQELIEDGEQRLHICDEWSVGEFGKLKAMLKQHHPKLVIIDSLTSISVDSLYSENEAEYARPLVRLRHVAKEFGCSFLVIHHSNANGDMRGSRAIRNTVDEVWKFTKTQNEIETYNVLTIDKTRSRAPGSYKFTYDDESWGWKFGGRVEDNTIALGAESQSTSIMTKCIQYLKQNRGIPYESGEVAEALGLNRDSVRRDLKRAVNEGLVNSGRSQSNKRALVYYVGTRMKSKENITTDQLINGSDQPLITSSARQDEGYRLSDQVINENPKFLNEAEKKFADQIDQLITSPSNPDTSTKLSDQPEVITSDQLITSVDHLSHSVTIPEPPKIDAPLSKPIHHKNIEEGNVYLSWSLGKQVKVKKIYPSVKKADVFQPKEVEPIKLPLADLFPLPDDDWKPNTGKLAMYGGELVAVVGFRNNGREFQIEFKSGRLDYAKAKQLAKPEL
ncbi:DnaB-like helicase N-terminal domain-containing protein [Aulosira sp. FACHB-615]|uniref:replicative DNA helicase n=1 Tax=Aulosira sp. FACHB-615 TaxID=2692777 RepID=UPI001681CF4E|nr:DnaB-like helicase N-terminal domain-containing protein [Aulosira sp. FACHB-615]MBD2491130.1 AAA family ATPase [Aulosira sp. FACHB-615]